MGEFLRIQPSELKFPFELMKQSSCTMQLINKTDTHVLFKVKTTNPKKYCVRPNAGVVLPGSTSTVTVTMRAQKEAPPELQCKDKFLIQSVVAPEGTTTKSITSEMFKKEDGKVVDEFKLRVVYIPANPPSPVPEGSDEESSPKASIQGNGDDDILLRDAASRPLEMPKEKSSEELLRKRNPNHGGGFSLLFVVLTFTAGFLFGLLFSSLVGELCPNPWWVTKTKS